MRTNFSSSVPILAITAVAVSAVLSIPISRAPAKLQQLSARRQPRTKTPWGEPDFARHLDRRNRHALAAPRQVREPGVFYPAQRSRLIEDDRSC